MADGLPDGVARFLAAHVRSVEDLEVLLLLQRSAPRGWSVREVASELRTSELAAETALRRMQEVGLLASANTSWSWSGASDAEVRALADAYRDRRVAVITAIFTGPTDAMRRFADAFRIGGPDKDKPR